MIYTIILIAISSFLTLVAILKFIEIINFNKKNNFDKSYKATRIDANKYSVDKWVK